MPSVKGSFDRATARYLYVASVGDQSKVGVSKDPEKRRRFLSCDLRQPVEIVRVWDLPEIASQVELVCIYGLARHATWLGMSEYFSISPDALVEFVERAIKEVEAGLHPKPPHVLRREKRQAEEVTAEQVAAWQPKKNKPRKPKPPKRRQ